MFIGFVTDGEADFVQNLIPMPEVWTNIVTGGKRTLSKTLYQCLKYGRILAQGGGGLRLKLYTKTLSMDECRYRGLRA